MDARALRARTCLPRDRLPPRPGPTPPAAPSPPGHRPLYSRRTCALCARTSGATRGDGWPRYPGPAFGWGPVSGSRCGLLLPAFVRRLGRIRDGLRRLLQLGASGFEELVLIVDEVLRALLDGARLLDAEAGADGELVLVF